MALDRLKRILALSAIGAVGVAGTAVGQIAAPPPPLSLGAAAAHSAARSGASALQVVAANPDENGTEAIERADRAAGSGGRVARGVELREETGG